MPLSVNPARTPITVLTQNLPIKCTPQSPAFQITKQTFFHLKQLAVRSINQSTAIVVRQKQYFEQKRRQQQQTSGYDNNADAANPCGQYHQKSKSLDVLTLQNLEAAAQECKSTLTNEAEESAQINASPAKCLFPNCSPLSLRSRLLPKYATAQKEAPERNPSGYEVEHTSPKKASARTPVEILSSCGHSSKRSSNVLDNQKKETDHQFSVLDLLGDDGSNEQSEGNEVHEAHVAFSVQGLGNMGTGTPLHSPRQPSRLLTPPKPLRQHQSSKKHNYRNDLEFELDSIIHDIDLASCDSPLGVPIDTRNVKGFRGCSEKGRSTVEEGIPLNSHFCQRDIFCGEEEHHCINLDDGNSWEAGPGFIDENFPDKGTHHAAWKNQAYNINNDFANFLRDEGDDESDFTFEDSSWTNRRDVTEEPRDFNILESPASYLKHRAPENDHDLNLGAKRYPRVHEGWDYGPPPWSPSAADENEKDIMSFLSESSATSSAVEGSKAKYSVPKSVLGKGPRKYKSEFCRNNAKVYSSIDMFGEGTVYRKGAKGFGIHTKVTDPSRAGGFKKSNNPVRFPKDSCSQYSWLFEEEFTSDSPFNSFQRTYPVSELASECEYSFESPYLASPSPSLYHNSRSPCKKSKHDTPVKHAPCCSRLFSEKTPSLQPFNPLHCYDSPSLVDIVSNQRKPAISQASIMQVEPSHSNSVCQGDMDCPALSGEGKFPGGGKEKSDNQPSGCGSSPEHLEREFTVVNNENEQPMEASVSKGNVESIEAENETPEYGDQPITRDFPEHVEEISSAKREVPGELERFLNEIRYKFDGQMPFPVQDVKVEKDETRSERTSSGSKGNDSKSPSYQVMLESYVLQLLCVQKVLREASEHDSAKKA